MYERSSVLNWGRLAKKLGNKCSMVWRTSTVCNPHHCSSVKEQSVCGERIIPETLVAEGRHANNRAMCQTPMLETVPLVWKVKCPELGKAGEDAGHGVHYDTENLYCMLSSSLKHRKEPLSVPGRESNHENLSMAGRCVNNRAMCGIMMVEIEPVVWKVECPELGEAG